MTTATKELVAISPPKFKQLKFHLIGTAPLVQARFSGKVLQAMMEKMKAGSVAKKGTPRKARDFNDDFKQAQHISTDGWIGIPAPALRNACIDVCRMVGFKMTHAKMSIFVEADGFDAVDGSPLIRLIADAPEQLTMAVRNQTGVADIRVRPMWRKWALDVVVKYDSDQFNATDVANLISRAGQQIGIGEGRPYSKSSNGLGYGTFTIAEE
jgi:hypothetical protein